MSAEQFPLCAKAGLSVVHVDANGFVIAGPHPRVPFVAYVSAEQVEKLLAAAPVYYGANSAALLTGYMKEGGHYDFSCRVVCEEPLVRDTAESLLKAFVAEVENDRGYDFEVFCQLRDRARRLLGQEGGK